MTLISSSSPLVGIREVGQFDNRPDDMAAPPPWKETFFRKKRKSVSFEIPIRPEMKQVEDFGVAPKNLEIGTKIEDLLRNKGSGFS